MYANKALILLLVHTVEKKKFPTLLAGAFSPPNVRKAMPKTNNTKTRPAVIASGHMERRLVKLKMETMRAQKVPMAPAAIANLVRWHSLESDVSQFWSKRRTAEDMTMTAPASSKYHLLLGTPAVKFRFWKQ